MEDIQSASSAAGSIAHVPLRMTATDYHSDVRIKLDNATAVARSAHILEDPFIRRYYDIGPERTDADFRREYDALMGRLAPHLHEYVDIDLPIVDSGGDW